MKDVSAERRRNRQRRHYRVRKSVNGTAERPRLAIHRSNKHITAQVIDDNAHVTLASASTVETAWDGVGNTVDAASKIGELVASRAKDAGISTVVFDRGGNLYHGRIAALADAAREAGLEF
jgi:large subunit ribosomal protein L18